MTSPAFVLEVGRIALAAQGPPGIRVREDHPFYASFLSARPDRPGHVSVPVTLDCAAGALPPAPALFDTGQTWRLARDGADLVFTFPPVWEGDPLRGVRVEASGAVTVHLAPHAIADGVIENPLRYPIDQLLFMHRLPRHEGLLVHAAGVQRGGSALAFLGRSGAGKSTVSRLLADREAIELLSDDRVLIRHLEGETRAFGTPWAGTEGIAFRREAGLRALLFLHQADRNQVRPLSPSAAFQQLLPVASIPWFDPARAEESLAVCADLLARVPAYELHFRKEPDVLAAINPLLR